MAEEKPGESRPPLQEKHDLEALLPWSSSSSSSKDDHDAPPPPSSRSKAVKRITVALLLVCVLYQFQPRSVAHLTISRWTRPHGDASSSAVRGYFRHVATKYDELAPPCLQRQQHHLHGQRLRPEEVEAALLKIPNRESARAASHSFTGVQHVAGTENDHKMALQVKAQWEELLGLPLSGDKGRVYEAGSEESKSALMGTGSGCREERWARKLKRWTTGGRWQWPSREGERGRRVRWLGHRHRHRHRHDRDPEQPRVWVDTYYPLLNYPVSHSLSMTYANATRGTFVASLKEDVLEEDKTSADGPMTFHGYAKSGAASGQLVYVSRGTKEDFDTLKEKGVDVKGKIVIAQYGGVFRGLKVKNAAEAGAIGCLIYTDPAEDGDITIENGYEAYPHGPARQPSSVQRGSAQFLSIYPGDPLTRGQPAYKDAKRLPSDDPSINTPSIPSLPISYQDALPLLRSLNGHGHKLEDRPGFKEGGLRFEGVDYFTGPGQDTVEMDVRMDDKVTPIWNTMAVIPGHLKDEVVIVGNHNDAWTFGAGDPNSGTASVHEIVKAFGQLRERGWKPLRTIVVASWDAEEFGLIGSTEFGEDYSTWLKKHVVAYLNVDMSASGSGYGVRASPSLARLFKSCSAKVDDPVVPGRSLLEALVGDHVSNGTADDLQIGPLGSGSDFTVFLQYLGIASSDLSFSRKGSDPVYHYHSNYDSQYWMDRFGDPTFARHEAIAKTLGLAALRLADSLILPIDVEDYAKELGKYLAKVEDLVETLDGGDSVDLSALKTIIDKVQHAASAVGNEIKAVRRRFEELRLNASNGDAKHGKHHSRHELHDLLKRARSLNKRLQAFEGTFIDQGGLPGRTWYKSLVIAPGRNLGYGATPFPGVTEALTLDRDARQATVEVERLVKALEKTTKLLRSA